MEKLNFDTPVLKAPGLMVKFDTIPVSASLAILIGDRNLAQIVQQLHYWTLQGYGEVIDGARWFYKSIKEWIEEVFPTFSSYQLGKMMKQLADRGIIRREKLFTKHQIQKGDRFWWQPKNQTYYYSLNYEKLQEEFESYQVVQMPKARPAHGEEISPSFLAESTENSVFAKTKILSDQEFEHTKDFDYSKNNTNKTSIENNSIDKSHPHHPSEWKKQNKKNSQAINSDNLQVVQQEQVHFSHSKIPEPEINTEKVEVKINQNISINKGAEPEILQQEAEAPKLKKTPRGTKPKRKGQAPWKNERQFKRFYRALIEALPIVANARSPQGLAQTIIRQLRSGIPHSYWDDFAAGIPIGSSDKPEWEIEPGVPYPMFIEYLTEKLKAGNNTKTDEQTRNEVFRILEKPRQAKAFWGIFKRSVVNVSEQVERDRALGVSNPNTPVWTRERIEPSIEDAAKAGQKITAVNDETKAILESTLTLQLESKEPPPVPLSPSLHSSESLKKSKEVSPPDPWSEDRPDAQRSGAYAKRYPSGQLTMREMLEARGVKGFCKPMPKVSQAEIAAEKRKQTKPKTNIAQMSLAEINEYLTDPILEAQLTPQLIDSDYELITDELGQIIKVELSELQKREKQNES